MLQCPNTSSHQVVEVSLFALQQLCQWEFGPGKLEGEGLVCLDHDPGFGVPNQLSGRGRGEAAMVVVAAREIQETMAKPWGRRHVCAAIQREISWHQRNDYYMNFCFHYLYLGSSCLCYYYYHCLCQWGGLKHDCRVESDMARKHRCSQ